MSGRKKSEVQDLLRSGEKIRNATGDDIDKAIDAAIKNISDKATIVEECKKSIPGEQACTEAALDLFPSEAKKQMVALQSLKKELSNCKVDVKAAAQANKELEDIKQLQIKNDREAASIRSALAGKSHYCDDEYKRASVLQKSYKMNSDKRREIKQSVSSQSIDADANANKARRIAKEIMSCQEAINGLNIAAENRIKADFLKKSMTHDMGKIDQAFADKFFHDEYVELKNDIKISLDKSDEVFLEGATVVMQKLSAFIGKLNNRIAEYHQQKADADDMANNAKELLKRGFITPEDYLQEGLDGEKTALFEYLDKYIPNDYNEKIVNILKEADAHYAQEEFVKAQELYKEAYQLANEANDKAINLQESLLKKTELTFTIRDTMYNLMYDVDVQAINGNPAEGFKITCNMGDEIIEFTKIDYDSDGKPVIDINHTESRTGNCGASWRTISDALEKENIPVGDIYTVIDGKSVIHTNEVKGKSPKEATPFTRRTH